MSKYLIVSDEFYPYDNASTNCLSHIISEIVKQRNDVTVLCCSYSKDLPLCEKKDGYCIKRIYMNPFQLRYYKDYPLAGESFFKSFFHKVIGLLCGVLKRLKYFVKYEFVLKNNNFDYILSIHFPPKNNDIVFSFPLKKEKWIVLYFDPYVYNKTLSRNVELRKIKEKIWIHKIDGIVNFDGISQENEKNNYFPYTQKKHLDIPLPNLVLDTFDNNNISFHQKVIICYTGMFYEDIRNPNAFIDLFYSVNSQKYSFEFYGDSCNYLENHYKKLPECFILKGAISAEECKKVICDSDILFNLSNKCTNQIPSKVFEYISTGKPILNFYYSDEDPSLKYFLKYPNVYCQKIDECCNIENVLEELKSKATLSQNMLAEIYSDVESKNIVKQIIDFIENC